VPSNYLENLRFALVLENLFDQTVNPEISVGLNNDQSHKFIVDKKHNELVFDEKIYSAGKNTLTVKVKELEENSYELNSFIVRDLRINGISVNRLLYQCTYYPHYDDDYAKSVPDLPQSIQGGLYIGNRGSWQWFFTAPIIENSSMKLGLW